MIVEWAALSVLLLALLLQAVELRRKDRELKELRATVQRLTREQQEQFAEFYKEEVWTIG